MSNGKTSMTMTADIQSNMNPYKFFEALKRNNNRPWYAEHKPEYEAIRQWWLDGMARVHALVAEQWPEVTYSNLKTFRIYRDTRFSADKTPYKTHIGSTLAPPSSHDVHCPGVYLEVGIPDTDSGVFAGIWAPENKVLQKLRKAIVDNREEWEEIVNDPTFLKFYPEWFGERLKTAPKGWPKDHPMIEYLRLKHIGKYSAMTRRDFMSDKWPDIMAERIIAAVPMLRFLDYSLNEE